LVVQKNKGKAFANAIAEIPYFSNGHLIRLGLGVSQFDIKIIPPTTFAKTQSIKQQAEKCLCLRCGNKQLAFLRLTV